MAPPLLEVLRQFDGRCVDGAIVSGWNTKFDEAFLYRAYRQCGLPWRFDYHIFDVWSLYKHLQLIGKLPADLRLGLGTIAHHFNIVRDGEDAHDLHAVAGRQESGGNRPLQRRAAGTQAAVARHNDPRIVAQPAQREWQRPSYVG